MIGYLDCSTGVSGDKLLGALIDCGFDLDVLRAALVAIGLGTITVEAPRCGSGGVTGAGVHVTEPGAPRRTWHELRRLLTSAPVTPTARDAAVAALTVLAEAEAQVHGVSVEEVHFHEIGAADTVADLLGIALAMSELGIGRLAASPIALGGGTVMTEHGELPVPAPATAVLLKGMPVVPGPAGGELTTPTGAAAVRTFVTGFGPVPPMIVRRVGTGCGTRDIGTPNVCRLILGEEIADSTETDDSVLLETNIDHLTPEELAYAAERVRAAGALDVWQTPIVMKKGRAAVLLSALVAPADAARIADRIMLETGTLGVRMVPAARRIASRDVTEVTTPLGTARFKVATLAEGTRVLAVEHDDAARIAGERSLPIHDVARVLENDAAHILGIQPRRQRPSPHDTNPSD